MAFFKIKRNKGNEMGVHPFAPFLLIKERYTYTATHQPTHFGNKNGGSM
jgi:hypothetical protein